MKTLAIVLTLALVATSARAQDQRGEITLDAPEYRGTHANAPIPPELHIKNEGSDVGNHAGLCVISSILCDGRYQDVPGLEGGKESALWKAAKAREGGYYPEKLEQFVNEQLPGEKWFSWEGTGLDLLKEYSAKGYPVGVTMNTGALYNYESIHHMVSLVHLDDKLACVVDNNDPGKYHWMPADEFARRFVDGPKGWGFVWLRLPGGSHRFPLPAALLFASGALLWQTRRSPRRQVAP